MKCFALLALLLVATCTSKPEEPASAPKSAVSPKAEAAEQTTPERPATAMERDLDRICNAEEQSGALDLQPGERAMHVGIWLAKNIESQEARDLMAELTRLSGTERARRLQQELTTRGVPNCEILLVWGGGDEP